MYQSNVHVNLQHISISIIHIDHNIKISPIVIITYHNFYLLWIHHCFLLFITYPYVYVIKIYISCSSIYLYQNFMSYLSLFRSGILYHIYHFYSFPLVYLDSIPLSLSWTFHFLNQINHQNTFIHHTTYTCQFSKLNQIHP